MTTPAAKGLFHKGIIQSGAVEACGMTNVTTEIGRRVAELTLNNLGIGKSEIAELQNVPYKELEAAGNAAMTQAAKEYGSIDSWEIPGCCGLRLWMVITYLSSRLWIPSLHRQKYSYHDWYCNDRMDDNGNVGTGK